MKQKYVILCIIAVAIILTGIIIFSGMNGNQDAVDTNVNATITNTVSNNTNIASKSTNTVTNNTNSVTNNSMSYSFPGILSDAEIQNKKVVITTSKGVIEFTLNAKAAPKSVSNFVYLAKLGYYDNLTFHRVEPGFVIQGGDPSGNGTGGPGYKFEDEPVQGEYMEGAVAMANAGANTNGSQFFITLADVSKSLPKQYNLFGKVTKGLEVVHNISIGDIMTSVKIVNQ